MKIEQKCVVLDPVETDARCWHVPAFALPAYIQAFIPESSIG